jgi:hypothetical protein
VWLFLFKESIAMSDERRKSPAIGPDGAKRPFSGVCELQEALNALTDEQQDLLIEMLNKTARVSRNPDFLSRKND